MVSVIVVGYEWLCAVPPGSWRGGGRVFCSGLAAGIETLSKTTPSTGLGGQFFT